jgi:hypothetical protein
VARRCREAHGNMLLRNVFQAHWPCDAEDLEDCTVALARDAGLDPEIADVTGLSERTVTRRLRGERGNMLVGNAFPELHADDDEEDDVEEDADDDDGVPSTLTEEQKEHAGSLTEASDLVLLGETHVASARSSSMMLWLAQRLGRTPRKMRGLLQRTHGRTLLRNALADVWPVQIGDDAPQMLGDMSVAAVLRSVSLVCWIARTCRTDFDEVAKLLVEADGHRLVRNVLVPWTDAPVLPPSPPAGGGMVA